jgi:ATPase subunit of ABC transporter with duplicated ATPase domains
MIVTKGLRANVLGEPIFENVNLVIQAGERVGVFGTRDSDVTIFLRIIAGEEDMDAGKVTLEGERVAYLSSEAMREETETLHMLHRAKPTFLLIDIASAEIDVSDGIRQFIRGFRGGILIASNDADLIQMVKVTRAIELHAVTKSISSYTGSYAEYLVEREKSQARMNEAYEKQQKEKRRIEGWLEQKRIEANINRSPDKGSTIRAKTKYLQRKILDQEIPNPESNS